MFSWMQKIRFFWNAFIQSSGDQSDPSYRMCVGIMMLNHRKEIFVGKRHDGKGWQMPQGGVDFKDGRFEPFESAAWRELHEEVGTKNCILLGQTDKFYRYNFPKLSFSLSAFWRLRFKGQKQKWFAFYFMGRDEDIDLSVTHFQEFLEWRWVSREDLPQYTPRMKKHVYEGAVEELWPCVEAYFSLQNRDIAV